MASPIIQLRQYQESVMVPRTPGRLRSSIRLPYAPQFWVELFEWVTNALVRLFKMREEHREVSAAFREMTIDRAKVALAAGEHVHEFLSRTGEHPKVVLMGRDEFMPFVGELRDPLCFDTGSRFGYANHYGSVQYFGVRVMLVPWMKGMVALPDLTDVEAVA